jgi:hypothetical protein
MERRSDVLALLSLRKKDLLAAQQKRRRDILKIEDLKKKVCKGASNIVAIKKDILKFKERLKKSKLDEDDSKLIEEFLHENEGSVIGERRSSVTGK